MDRPASVILMRNISAKHLVGLKTPGRDETLQVSGKRKPKMDVVV
jgi:hypothetical protein